MRHASQSLSALLTGQVQFVKGTSADGETTFSRDKKQGEDEEQGGSPMKRSRTASQQQRDTAHDDKGAAASADGGGGAAAAADAAAADEDDDNTAAWFKKMTQKHKNGDEGKGGGDEDGADDNTSDATKNKGVKRRSSLAAKPRFPHPTSISPPPEGSEFTTNWFTHNQPALLRVFEALGWAGQGGTTAGGGHQHHHQPKHILEVGCWEGRGSQWLLTTLCRRQDAVYSHTHTPTRSIRSRLYQMRTHACLSTWL